MFITHNFPNQRACSSKIATVKATIPVTVRRYLPLENFTTLGYITSAFYDLPRLRSCSSSTIFQIYKLRKLLVHAFHTVPYYRDLFKSLKMDITDVQNISLDNLCQFPIIKREDLIGLRRNDFLSECCHMNDLVRIKTSGTSDDPLEILYIKNDFLYLNMIRLRAQMLNGLKPWSRVLIVLAERDIISLNKDFWFQKIGLFKIKFLNAYEKIDIQINAIRTFDPDIIISYPSLLMQLTDKIGDAVVKNNKQRKRTIFTSGEVLTQHIRRYIEDAFRAKIVDFYGSGEFECIAFECPNCHKYHTNSDAIIVEVIKEDGSYAKPGESGFVVGTNLHSFAMPIVRYMTGDIVQLSTDKDSNCKLGYPIFDKILRGRDIVYIELHGGEKLSLFKLKSIIKQFENLITQFQFQEAQKGQLSLVVSLSQPVKTNIDSMISEEFYHQLKIELKVISSNKFMRTVNGKVPEYVSYDMYNKLNICQNEYSYS